MRLIGEFATEKEAFAFYSFLLKEGIQNIYEPHVDKSGEKHYCIWIYDEDDLEIAVDWLKKFKEAPDDHKFRNAEMPLSQTQPPPNYSQVSEEEELKWKPVQSIKIKERRFSFTLTYLIIAACAFLYLWNDFQEAVLLKKYGLVGEQIAMTPVMKALLFDVSASYRYIEEVIEKFPLNTYKEEKEIPPPARSLLLKSNQVLSWKGIYDFFMTVKKYGWDCSREIPMFEKVRQGEVWRLFTPCIFHREFFHILFNMIWAWILLKQIELRLKKWKIGILILLVAVVSNTAQYLMSGPDFLGFSGVVVGLAGFIWMRQKKAPWEGYPLQRGTLLFLLLFVLAMFVLELFSFSLHLFSAVRISAGIGNTAHIIGGAVGLLLGRMPFFGRSAS
jgi:GlpG protein